VSHHNSAVTATCTLHYKGLEAKFAVPFMSGAECSVDKDALLATLRRRFSVLMKN